MDKLFLFDAYALIYRAYYAFIKNPRINTKGMNTSAVLGFCNTLHEVLAKEKPTYLGVAFDPHGPTFRSEAYAQYKAQREETPEDIRRSVPIIKEILKAMRIPVLEAEGFEADDVIGTLAKKADSEGIRTYMLTPDKDYGQLVGGNVVMYRPRHGGGYETLDEAGVCQKYGITGTAQVIDLLGLMGDAADNIPGCPGVGEKTAVKLLQQFGSVDALLERTGELKGALKKKVEENAEQIRFSKFLATIRTDVPVELDLEKLRVTEPDTAELRRLFTELEFKTLLDKFLNNRENIKNNANGQLDLFSEITTDGQVGEEKSALKTLTDTPHTYKLVDTEEDMLKLRDFFMTKSFLSLDTETTSTNTIDAELVGLSFSVSENEAFYVPVPADRQQAQNIVNIFKPVYEQPSILKIGQNIKYDMEVLANYGVELAGEMFDTMLAHYLLQPEQRHNMDDMAETYLGYRTIHIDELIGPKGKGQKSMRDLPPAEVYEYAAEDADVTLKLKNLLEPKLKESGVWQLFSEVEMPLVRVLASMERNGVRLDTDSLKETSQILTARMNDIEQEIYRLAGEEFNIASPRQDENRRETEEDQDRAVCHVRGSAPAAARKERDCGQDTGTQGVEEAPRHIRRRPAEARQPTDGAHTHVVQPDGYGHRAALVQRPQPTEHTRARRGRQGDTQGVRARGGLPVLLRRLLSNRTARDGAPQRRREHAGSLPRRLRHPRRNGCENLPRDDGQRHARPAHTGQARQLRHNIRHHRVRTGRAA